MTFFQWLESQRSAARDQGRELELDKATPDDFLAPTTEFPFSDPSALHTGEAPAGEESGAIYPKRRRLA